MDRTDIKKLLPHREPMLLVDEIFQEADGSVRALYRVPEDAFYCQGHFPGNPIVPGVILCEIMAQSCCMLFPEAFEGNLLVYRGLDAVKFRGQVKPGDLCEISCRLLEHKGSIYVCATKLSVGGRLAAQAQVTLAAVAKG